MNLALLGHEGTALTTKPAPHFKESKSPNFPLCVHLSKVGACRRSPVLPPLPLVLDSARLQDGAPDDVRRIKAFARQGGRHHKSVRVQGPGGLHRRVADRTASAQEMTGVVFQFVTKSRRHLILNSTRGSVL